MTIFRRKRKGWLGLIGLLTGCGISAACFAQKMDGQLRELIAARTQQALTVTTPQTRGRAQSTRSTFNTLAQSSPWALVLVYRATCPHCQRFDPLVKDVAARLQLHTFAYTTDGQSLPSFPHSLLATRDVIKTLYGSLPHQVPALFVVNVNTLGLTPVTLGEVSEPALLNRLTTVLTQLKDKTHAD